MLHQICEAFKRGDLELGCAVMQLRQEGVDQPMSYGGPGLIRQNRDRQLEFRLFCTSKEGEQRYSDPFYPEGSVTLGQLVPPHHYYTLRATDQHGGEWVASRFQIDRDTGKSLVLSGRPQDINLRQNAMHTRSRLVLRVRGDFDIPANCFTHETHVTGGEQVAGVSRRDAAKFQAMGHEFLIRKEAGWLTVVVEATDGNLPEHYETRVIEALQFVLGRSLWWSLMSKVAGGEEIICLRAERGHPGPHLMPPFNFCATPDVAPAWQMFEKYLAHVSHHRGEKFHSTSAWLRMARNAHTASVFSSGLALGVVIEGVLKSEFRTVGTLPPDLPEKARAILQHLQLWEGDDKLKSRVTGAISGMLEVRAKDRLHALKDRGVVTAKQIRAWAKLRNSAAHARPPEDDELQEWIDLGNAGLTTLYHLIFAATGYTGEYTDYAALDWPVSHYSGDARAVDEGEGDL